MAIAPRQVVTMLALCGLLHVVLGGEYREPKPTVACYRPHFLLITDIGFPVSRCPHCYTGFKQGDAVTAFDSSTDELVAGWTKCWRTDRPDEIMFKVPRKEQFLGLCHNCHRQASYSDSAALLTSRTDKAMKWTMTVVRQDPAGDVVTLKGSNGKYLARCEQCIQGQAAEAPLNSLFVYETDGSASAAQFRMVPIIEPTKKWDPKPFNRTVFSDLKETN